LTSDLDDHRLRLAAVEHVTRLGAGGAFTSDQLYAGFVVDGHRVALTNVQRGIFKPAAMRHLLSVKTVFPTQDRKIWYDDQREVHEQIARGEELIDYAFMGSDPQARENRWMREAMEAQVPIIYFLGVAPQRWIAIWPTYIADWSAHDLKARLAFGAPAHSVVSPVVPEAPERRYGLRQVRQRLHQATFREAVLTAYAGRCAFTGLPEPRLLDAAHIIPDADEVLGQPLVSNGIPMSKFHHAAYDANLIGIDPDYTIHISPQLLSMNDGPMFEQGLKALNGARLRLPPRTEDQPDRARLEVRFASFLA
jgi:putative restriction endonuclease